MKTILNRLIQHETLCKEEAKQTLVNISNGQYNPAQIASFLTVYMMRSITIEELAGFREALLELCIPVNLSDYDTIDLCGTGGDGKNTFNISTLASFIAAGAGINVAKHGNYGVSSISGSSNVMENLGIKFSNDSDFLKNFTDQFSFLKFLLNAETHTSKINCISFGMGLITDGFFNTVIVVSRYFQPLISGSTIL